MSVIIPKIIKDFGDGDVEIEIIANFTYHTSNKSLLVDIVADFQTLMEKYAI